MMQHAIEHGGQFRGLLGGSGSGSGSGALPAALVAAAVRGVREDIAGAILEHADARREKGEKPTVLLSLVAQAQSVLADIAVPLRLQRAIRGWAGARGEGMSGQELDSLWSSMLQETAGEARRRGRPAPPPEEQARVAASYLEGLVPTERPSEQRAVRGGRSHKKKGGKKRGGAGRGGGRGGGGGHVGRRGDEGSDDEEEAGAEGEGTRSVDDSEASHNAAGASAAQETPEDEECPICHDDASDLTDWLFAPCEGRHGIYRRCAIIGGASA